MSLPKQLLESKLITNEQWKEYQELKEEVNDLRTILNMQHEREYYSKFLKDFQGEKGKNVYPDFDEIYKRYDKQKEEIERLNKELDKTRLSELNKEYIINELEKYIRTEVDYIEFVVDPILDKLQELKGSNKSE